MTCVIAYTNDKKIFMGADSGGFSNGSVWPRKDPKIFINGPMLIGITGSYRMGNILRYSFKVPVHPKGMSISKYMNTRFINAIRKCFVKEGFMQNREGENSQSGTAIIGYKGKIFALESDFQIGQYFDSFISIGYGGVYACSAMDAVGKIFDIKKEPFAVIENVLNSVEKYCHYVRGPFVFLEK